MSEDTNVLSRAVFLSYALLTSSASSDHRTRLCTAVMPRIAHLVCHSDLNIRDFALRLLVQLRESEEGLASLRQHRMIIQSSLKEHSDSIAVEDKADQFESEYDNVAALRSILAQLE